MFKTYFRIVWRNFKHDKIFSPINIIGLSVGLACYILITLFIMNERDYDKYQKNALRIYKAGTTFIQQGETHSMPNTPTPMGETMQLEFPEIEKSARLMGLFAEDKTLLRYDDSGDEEKSFYEKKGCMVDPSFFNIWV